MSFFVTHTDIKCFPGHPGTRMHTRPLCHITSQHATAKPSPEKPNNRSWDFHTFAILVRNTVLSMRDIRAVDEKAEIGLEA